MCSGDRTPPFDRIGERYEQSFTDRTEDRRALSWMIERLPPGARVLDLGCGTGTPTAVCLADAGMEVVGIDESERMIRLARASVPSGSFHCGDMRELGDELGQFDAATAFFSLPMLSKRDIAQLLRNVRARLRGPGLLAVSTVEGDFDRLPLTFLGVEIQTTAYPPAALAEEITAAGFRVEEVWYSEAMVEAARVERQIYLVASGEDVAD